MLAPNDTGDEWLITVKLFDKILHQKLVVNVDSGRLTGRLSANKLEGSISGNVIHFTAKGWSGITFDCTGTISEGSMSGSALLTHDKDAALNIVGEFSAHAVRKRRPGPPEHHNFSPTTFYHEFSTSAEPALTVWPGDTVRTLTLDSFGVDELGVRRVLGFNPQTGPIYVETAMPGDVLSVRLIRLYPIRDWAVCSDSIVGRALGVGLAMKMRGNGSPIRWRLDREQGIASPEKCSDKFGKFTIPLRPMLGCVGVAPGFGVATVSTDDSGHFGGNLDFNEICEGATVYLPVGQPGAMLYFGDGHAAQGDGELNGCGLEVPMNVEFSVEVCPDKTITTPRVQSPTHFMAIGLAGSLDIAIRIATAGLAEWVEGDFGLSPSEIAQVLGSVVEYRICEIADRNVGVVAKLRREYLSNLECR